MNIRVVPIRAEHRTYILIHIHFGGLDLQFLKFEGQKSGDRNFEISAIIIDCRAFHGLFFLYSPLRSSSPDIIRSLRRRYYEILHIS